jgi:hypothetical protein
MLTFTTSTLNADRQDIFFNNEFIGQVVIGIARLTPEAWKNEDIVYAVAVATPSVKRGTFNNLGEFTF